MLIWDYIRDFLVQNIFGGWLSDGTYVDTCFGFDNGGGSIIGNDIYYTLNGYISATTGTDVTISLSDWLATTTTIIIMCLIVVLFAMLVRWVFKTVVSAFLLR